MDIFLLFFLVSFIALVITLALVHIGKRMAMKGDGVVNEEVDTTLEKCYFETVSDVATKWKLTLPHPSTRLKNRNKRKGKK